MRTQQEIAELEEQCENIIESYMEEAGITFKALYYVGSTIHPNKNLGIVNDVTYNNYKHIVLTENNLFITIIINIHPDNTFKITAHNSSHFDFLRFFLDDLNYNIEETNPELN